MARREARETLLRMGRWARPARAEAARRAAAAAAAVAGGAAAARARGGEVEARRRRAPRPRPPRRVRRWRRGRLRERLAVCPSEEGATLERQLLVAMAARRPELRGLLSMTMAPAEVADAIRPYREDVAAVLLDVAAEHEAGQRRV